MVESLPPVAITRLISDNCQDKIGVMITVTDKAKEELKRIVETRRLEPGKSLRLAIPPVWTGEGDFGIVIDEEKEDDYSVEDEGVTVLLLEGGLIEGALASAVVDFKETPDGTGFTVDIY